MNRARGWLCILLALFLQTAWADRVVPSNRVETQLKVRAAPSSTSAIVGNLEPGDSAQLVESVPHWHHIALDNGTRGYVSKAWSLVIAESTPPPAPDLIRLGGWNIKKLGHGTSTNFALVVQIIAQNFDIVAVVEVMQRSGGRPGYDTLLQQLGPAWSGMITSKPRPNTSAGDAEFYAILYRPQRIQPCDGWSALRYLADNDGSASGSGPDLFSREPAFGCFAARLANGSTGFDFMLAAYHARWESGNTAAIKNEVKHVTKVFEAMKQARPGEKDLILVGDFNLVTSNLESVLGPQVQTLGSGSTLNTKGERTNNLYDHLLLHDQAATNEMVGNPQVLDVRDVAASPKVFYQTVSDHLPVSVQFRSAVDDD